MKGQGPNRSSSLQSLLYAYSEGPAVFTKWRQKLIAQALDAVQSLVPPMEPTFGEHLGDGVEPRLIRELLWALKCLAKKKNARAYSLCLQVWLAYNDIPWPKAVFENDSNGPGSGPRPSELGFRASLMYKPRKIGWRKVAKALIPGDFIQDPDQATKRVHQAAEPYLQAMLKK